MIATSGTIRGLVVGDEELRVLAYADDVAFFCASAAQAGAVVELDGRCCRFPGTEINMTKSEGAWLGP